MTETLYPIHSRVSRLQTIQPGDVVSMPLRLHHAEEYEWREQERAKRADKTIPEISPLTRYKNLVP